MLSRFVNSTDAGLFWAVCVFDDIRVSAVTVVLGAVSVGLLTFIATTKKRIYPPGPCGFPVVGHLPFLVRDPSGMFGNWRKVYGDVFGIRLGSWSTVVVSGPVTLHGTMRRRGVLCRRPPFVTAGILREEYGGVDSFVFGGDGSEWRKLRSVLTRVIGSVTNGSAPLGDDVMQTEAEILTQDLIDTCTTAVSPQKGIKTAFGSVIYQLLFGKDAHTRSDPNFQLLIRSSDRFVAFFKTGIVFNAIPWLSYLVPWKQRTFRDIIRNGINNVRVTKQSEHESTFDSGHIRDVMDALLAADGTTQTRGPSRQQLVTSVTDLLGFGFVTLTAAMKWVLYFMSRYPDIQERVQKELDDLTQLKRKVVALDRHNLPFTEATIYECLRMAPIIPYAIPHFTTEDTTINGYHVDEGTVIFPNLYSVSIDENLWKDPTEFRPERFLTDTGELDKQATNRIVTFGLGERRCLGEQLAKRELFVFMSRLLQRCTVTCPGDVNLEYDVLMGMVYEPRNLELIVQERCNLQL